MSDDERTAVDAALAALPERHPGLRRGLIGFSGGVDSTALLLRAAAILSPAWKVEALHVHHGLQPDADRWADRCRETCARIGVPLRVERVQVADQSGGPEAAARAARYRAFSAAVDQATALLLAHHRDDQVETLLMNAARGAGTAGLAAMPAARRLGAGLVFRPLLEVPRATLVAIVEAARIEPVADPTNVDPARERGFLRRSILPAWRDRRAGIDIALARTARLCAATEEALGWFARRELAGRVDPADGSLALEDLEAVPHSVRAALIRAWIVQLGVKVPGEARLGELIRQCGARDDARVAVAWGAVVARRFRDRLHLDVPVADPPAGWLADWQDEELALPCGCGSLRWEIVDPGAMISAPPRLRVGFRAGGERITLPGEEFSRPVKQVLQDSGVPPWERGRLPLLYQGDELVAVSDRVEGRGWRDIVAFGNRRLVHEPVRFTERLTLARS